MAWIYLIIAGILETGWAIGLKYTDGFTRPVPSILTAAAIVASMVLLSFAARTLPIGTAYGIWVGIGTVGAVVLGMVLFDEPRTAGRIFFLVLLVVSLVGLKLTSSDQPKATITQSREAAKHE
jgi:quaternary ammonium compound-resistance protein SugE